MDLRSEAATLDSRGPSIYELLLPLTLPSSSARALTGKTMFCRPLCWPEDRAQRTPTAWLHGNTLVLLRRL
eukprot:scaffold406_cov391-Prasinococcus_capsulatus_cf.AAC.10